MAAFDGKDATEGISALSGLVPISPAAQAFPAVVPGLQVYIRDEHFVVLVLPLNEAGVINGPSFQRLHRQSARGATSRHSVCVQRQGELKHGTVGYV